MIEQGIYTDLSNMAYQGETDYVSSSALKRLLPEYYGPPPKDQTALWFGSAFHTHVLGGASEPWSVGDFPTWQSKAAKEHSDKACANGEVPVLQRDVFSIERMTQSLKNHREASRLLWDSPGQSEVSVFTEASGVLCRARYDRLMDDGTAVDVKTTSGKPSRHDLANAVIQFGYDISAEHYVQTGQAAGLQVQSLRLIFVGKQSPHYVTVVDLDDDYYTRGKVLRETAIDRLLNPEVTNAYDGATGVMGLSMPRWAQL